MADRLPLFGSTTRPISIPDEDYDYDSDATLDDDDENDEVAENNGSTSAILPTLPQPSRPWEVTDWCRLSQLNRDLRAKDVVELTGNVTLKSYWNTRNGDFFLVRSIIRNLQNGQIKLIGQRLRRNHHICEMLSDEDDVNEVFLLMPSNAHPRNKSLPPGLEEVHASEVFKVRELVFTNAKFPDMRSREFSPRSDPSKPPFSDKQLRDSGKLVCRWMFSPPDLVPNYSSAKLCFSTLKMLNMKECYELGGTANTLTQSDDDLLKNHRRGYLPYSPPPLNGTQNFYTFIDGFCGIGGSSVGAKAAGLAILFAIDIFRTACAAFKANFPEATVLPMSIDHAFQRMKKLMTDVLHLSTVCKSFSPACTRRSSRYEMHQATLFCVGEALEKLRPRVLTLEQTSGLLTHHPQFFRVLINMITSAGYSVRWKKLHLDEYGVPQCRKRLIVIASCPGGTLPEMPKPTHGPRSASQTPFVTTEQAIANVQRARNITHNDVPGATQRHRSSRQPHPPARRNAPLRRCITTGGPTESHPTERRYFTIREVALLMTFPLRYILGANLRLGQLMELLGNAFPPAAAEQVFREVVRTLTKEDQERGERLNSNRSGGFAL